MNTVAQYAGRWSAVILLMVLVACGGPGGPGGGGPDPIFEGREPYGGPLPEGARIVTLEVFKEYLKRDDVVWDSLARRERAEREAQAQFAADQAEIGRLVAQNPALARVLEVPDPDDPDVVLLPGGEYLVTIRNDDGTTFQVRTHGQQERFRDFLTARERFTTKENQLELYATAFAALPEPVRASLPSPTQLAAGSLSDITTAVAELNGVVKDFLAPPLVFTHALPPGYPDSPADELGAMSDFNARDWRACNLRSVAGLYDNFWWPLKHFQTSIKDQASRGTCTAFGLAAAVESIIAMTQGKWVNLSEQHLYFQSRGIWQFEGASTKDGFQYYNVPAGGDGYTFRGEQQWTYNRSPQRSVTSVGFENSCVGYDEVCSDTVHQGMTLCVPHNGATYCLLVAGNGPNTSGFSFGSIPFPDISTVIWEESQGTDIPLNLVRHYLDTGHPILTSLRADASFRNPLAGFVSEVAGAGGGGHVVLMVGFIPTEAILAHPTLSAQNVVRARAEASGGGFFIVKNSWGCSGDGGYLYIPVAWAEQKFERLRLPQRGPAPIFDHYIANLAPQLEITSPQHNSSFPLSPLLELDFSAHVEPFDCCEIAWASDKDGPLGTGRELTVSFAGAEPGPRKITATATRSDGKKVSASITITLTTSAPNVSIVFPIGGEYYRGLEYTFVAEEFSGPNAPQPCSAYSWSSSVAGEGPWSGCTPTVAFATTGPRTITVSLTNQFGQTGSDDVDITVVDPPDDGPPVVNITSPEIQAVFTSGQRAYVAYSVVDPSPEPPSSVAWSISYGQGGTQIPITLLTDPRPLPSRPSNRYFRPSDYVTPLCFHNTNPNLQPYVLRMTYTNAEGRSAISRVPIYLNADVSVCIN